jgi:hypothetical protein
MTLPLSAAPHRTPPPQIDMVIENNASAIRALEPLAEEIAALKAFSTGELRQRPAAPLVGRWAARGWALSLGTGFDWASGAPIHSSDCSRLRTATRVSLRMNSCVSIARYPYPLPCRGSAHLCSRTCRRGLAVPPGPPLPQRAAPEGRRPRVRGVWCVRPPSCLPRWAGPARGPHPAVRVVF